MTPVSSVRLRGLHDHFRSAATSRHAITLATADASTGAGARRLLRHGRERQRRPMLTIASTIHATRAGRSPPTDRARREPASSSDRNRRRVGRSLLAHCATGVHSPLPAYRCTSCLCRAYCPSNLGALPRVVRSGSQLLFAAHLRNACASSSRMPGPHDRRGCDGLTRRCRARTPTPTGGLDLVSTEERKPVVGNAAGTASNPPCQERAGPCLLTSAAADPI
jgi:hypothetical protein